MKITGINADKFRAIVDEVNKTYNGNIAIEDLSPYSDNRFRVKLGTNNSREFGSRTSASGRRGKYLCFHGFRDVFEAVFAENEDARIVTGFANYKNRTEFENLFPTVGDQNVGSMFEPVCLADLCSCDK